MFDVFVGLGSTQVTTPVGYNSCKARNNIWKEFQVAVQFVGRSPALPTTPPKKRGWDARVTQNQIDARVNALRVFPAVSMVDQKGAYTYFCQGFHRTTCRSRYLSGAAPATQSAATVTKEKFDPTSTVRQAEQRCYPERPRSQRLSGQWHGWNLRSQERT